MRTYRVRVRYKCPIRGLCLHGEQRELGGPRLQRCGFGTPDRAVRSRGHPPGGRNASSPPPWPAATSAGRPLQRGPAWLKVKPVHTLDLVVLAAAVQPAPGRAHRGRRPSYVVTVRPEQVVEIAFDGCSAPRATPAGWHCASPGASPSGRQDCRRCRHDRHRPAVFRLCPLRRRPDLSPPTTPAAASRTAGPRSGRRHRSCRRSPRTRPE